MKPRLLLALFALLAVAALALADTVTFSYDTAGRLTGATRNFTNVATFQYDGSGNLTRSASYIVADSDNDGMEDSFELSFFGNLGRNGLGDFDSDGLNDLAEFFAGTIPTNSASVLKMDRVVTNTLVLTTVSWLSVSGKMYRVQYKNTLADLGWNDLPSDVAATGTNTSKTDTTKAGQPQRFYRVQVLP